MKAFLIKIVLTMLIITALIGAFFWHEITTQLTHATASAFSDAPAGLCIHDEMVAGGYLPIKAHPAGGRP